MIFYMYMENYKTSFIYRDLLKVFYVKDTYYVSSVSGRPVKGPMSLGDLLWVFYI